MADPRSSRSHHESAMNRPHPSGPGFDRAPRHSRPDATRRGECAENRPSRGTVSPVGMGGNGAMSPFSPVPTGQRRQDSPTTHPQLAGLRRGRVRATRSGGQARGAVVGPVRRPPGPARIHPDSPWAVTRRTTQPCPGSDARMDQLLMSADDHVGPCAGCGSEQRFERPPCEDGHGDGCPERTCVTCGAAVLVGLVPAPRGAA